MSISATPKELSSSKASLQTERLILRAAQEGDLDDFFEMFSNEDVMRYWSGPPHTNKSKTKDYLDFMIASPTNGVLDFVLVLPSTGKVIGKAGIWETKTYEIGFMLNHAYWGQGHMADALQRLSPHIWQQGVESMIADVDPRNKASIGLLERFGFVEYEREERTIKTHLGWCDSVYLLLERPRENDESMTVEERNVHAKR